MQKTLEILEKNVQWIVLGLAALFLLWVAYGYVITPPATVKINNRIVTPADVAQVTEVSAKDLDRQMKDNKPVSFPTPDLVTSWRQYFAEPFAVAIDQAKVRSLPQSDTGPMIAKGGNGGPHIDVAPVPPAPQLLPVVAGLSTVIPQAPNPPQNINAGNPPPAAAAAPAQAVVAPAPKDTDWITVPAVISAKSFKDAMLAPFKGAPLDPTLSSLYNTTILRVVLERQKSTGMNNGAPAWPANNADIQTVAALSVNEPLIPALPEPSADGGTKYQYIEWATQNQTLLSDPSFYQVTAGDQWAAPQLPAPTPPGATPPAGDTPATPPATTPPPAAGTPAVPATPNSAGMRIQGNASYAPFDPSRPPGSFPHDTRFRPNRGFYAPPGVGNNVNGMIDPLNVTNDILIWAIDDTVTPGQTYRYRISYIIKNPVFDVKNMAPDKLTAVLTIPSVASNWSEPVTAPPMTKFWVASAQRDRASLDVFQYSGGEWKATKNLAAGPGDVVPGTDLTLVDVRTTDSNRGGREKYVLLTSNTGDMLRRDVNADGADPEHQQMSNPNPNPNSPNGPRPDVPPTMRPDRPQPRPPFRPTLGH